MRETAAGLQKKHLLFVDRLLFLYLFPVWKGGKRRIYKQEQAETICPPHGKGKGRSGRGGKDHHPLLPFIPPMPPLPPMPPPIIWLVMVSVCVPLTMIVAPLFRAVPS